MLRFWKVILENLKNWETFGYFSNLKFSRVFVMKFDSKWSWLEKKIIFERIYLKKKQEGSKNTPLG